MAQAPSVLAKGTTTYFQPKNPNETDSTIQKRLAFLVGLVAFGLPVVLAAGAIFGGSCFRDSISHFYYAQFLGAIFVGLLIFIGGFLIAYTGEHWLEDLGSFIAGIGACFVAIFPTSGSGCEMPASFLSRVFATIQQATPPSIPNPEGADLFILFAKAPDLHAYAAGTLFIYLGLYCMFVLRRVVPERHEVNNRLIPSKQRRNVLYAICGLTILFCVLVLGAVGFLGGENFLKDWNSINLTFVFETIALWAFGTAWFAKGRVFPKLNDT
ncbi:hypothetical protein [Ruegeria hyattellae]|uniref:hypothetical protein n=1 Tax=Ruegeria hyattellae TaxID=3233337 RepID=UPI00355C5994